MDLQRGPSVLFRAEFEPQAAFVISMESNERVGM